MRRIAVCLFIVMLLSGVANAQTKSMTGKVIETPKGMYAWEAIVIKVGKKKFFVYTLSGDSPSPKIVGTVDRIGLTVRVYYKKLVPSDGYDGELKATKIVEVKNRGKK